MDLSKYQDAFNNMSYDEVITAAKGSILKNTKSTVIVTESADLESASDFVSRAVHDPYQIRSVFVQASIEARFLKMLEAKLKPDADAQKQLDNFAKKGFPLINGAIVRCPNKLVAPDVPIVNLEVFRTTNEAVSFGKCSLSIGLWCENLAITFEYINLLSNARQIWLNSSFGKTNPKIPFYNNCQIVCEDADITSRAVGDIPGSTIQVTGHVRFVATFRSNTFQTVVIPFGESFAN